MTRSLSEVRGIPSKRLQFLTVAVMIVVNSMVIGTTCGLFVGMAPSSPMVASPIAGVTGAGTSLVVHFAHQLRVLRRHDGSAVDEVAIAVPTHILGEEDMYGSRL